MRHSLASRAGTSASATVTVMRTRRSIFRTLFFLFLLICLLGGLIGVAGVPVEAAPQLQAATGIVISEFRFRGDGMGDDEFIELYNPTSFSIDISGWLIRGSNNTGAVSTRATIPPATILQPGQYYLVANTGYTGPATADLTYGTGITDDGGVALTLPDTTTIIDQVGLSAGSAYQEGTPLTALTTNVDRGYERRIGGTSGSCYDTDDNSTNFQLINPNNPQNSLSPFTQCGYNPLSVIISEAAWAGTQAFSGDEWVELYNPGPTSVDLTGWRLEAADGEPSIALSGIIASGGFLVLERGDDNVVSDVNSPDSLVYNSGLFGDGGEILSLRAPDRTVIDTANIDGGSWPAGTTSGSMERVITGGVVSSDTASGWITNVEPSTWLRHDAANNLIQGTPGYANWAFTVTPTFTPTITLTPTFTFTPSPTNTSTPSPSATPAGFLSVVINEVAWMGTLASTTDEWIELYNPGSTAINITGWTLKALDGTPTIVLNGIIPAGGYFILERSDDNTISDVTADQIYTGDLENSNEVLQLIDTSNRTIDTANANSGTWPAGSTSTYGSMERRGVVADSDTAWITNANPASWTKHDARGTSSTSYLIRGTPGYANWAISVTATPSPRPTATRTPIRTSTPAPPPPPPLVAINEFVPRPGSDWNGDGVINTGDEYIELLNHGVVPVNLSGYRLDDEVNIGSSPFALPAITLQPGERIVFYGSDTGLLLGDGGDGVRLLRPNGTLMDAYNYFVVNRPDQAFCRLPDNGGADDWNTNCFPTPGLPNSFSGTVLRPPTEVDVDHPLCPIADTLPEEFALAECTPFGNNIWNRHYWDRFGWFGESPLMFLNGKWEVYAD